MILSAIVITTVFFHTLQLWLHRVSFFFSWIFTLNSLNFRIGVNLTYIFLTMAQWLFPANRKSTIFRIWWKCIQIEHVVCDIICGNFSLKSHIRTKLLFFSIIYGIRTRWSVFLNVETPSLMLLIQFQKIFLHIE